ncbi:hypothetical protein BJX61DRAFT_422718 [Aspergillus egyptiacus]|nr:hypothetical protein BJX61DRAFT_422718 [Aspergillus egyptiacus]
MNCYEILGIPPDAALKDINSAYKKLALKHHPDKAGRDDSATEFQKIQQAIEILRDPDRRKEHDDHLRLRPIYWSEGDPLFTSADYTGWTPNGMYRCSYNRRERYMFSYGNSVHMNPHSKESQEELAHCERLRQEEEEKRARRAAEFLAEEEARKARREKFLHSLRRDENRPSLLSPGGSPLRVPGVDGGDDSSDPGWWDEVEPDDEYAESKGAYSYDKLAAAIEVDPEFELNDAGSEIGSDVNNHLKFGGDIDADSNSAYDDEEAEKVKFECEPEPEMATEPDHDFGAVFETVNGVDTDADANATTNVEKNRQPVTESDEEPLIELEPGAEDDVESDSKPIIADGEVKVNVESKEACADIDTVKHASKPWDDVSRGQMFVGETMENNQDAFPPYRNSDNSMMSGALPPGCKPAQLSDPEACPVWNEDQESNLSIYYDFSDGTVYGSNQEEKEDSHNLSTDDLSDTSSSINSFSTVYYDLNFDDANIYPHLAPFVPYFTAKLAHRSDRYTEADFRVELKGMVMETYCGWLETLRVTIPGSHSYVDSGLDNCRHLGYWDKQYGCEECELCHLWKPIYTLVCPICGIKRCVGCKF